MAKQAQSSDIKCPQCGSTDFTFATDAAGKPIPKGKHYCSKCGHVWVPGAKIEGRADLTIQHLRKENEELKQAIERERRENAELKKRLVDAGLMDAAPGPTSTDDGSGDIFT